VIPEDYKGRFGWHNMRHSLATFLAGEVDPSQTMKMLRHKKLSTTMELYTHSVGSKQCEAQQKYLSAIGLHVVTGKTTGTEGQKQTA
jgi:integrase